MPYRVTCRVCGRVIVREQRRTHFCSQTCANLGRSAVPRAVPPPEYFRTSPEPLAMRPCAWCGTPFSPVDRHNPGVYCSVACWVLAEGGELDRQE